MEEEIKREMARKLDKDECSRREETMIVSF